MEEIQPRQADVKTKQKRSKQECWRPTVLIKQTGIPDRLTKARGNDDALYTQKLTKHM